jgi:hypothetical protein
VTAQAAPRRFGSNGTRLSLAVIALVFGATLFAWGRGVVTGGPAVPVRWVDAGPESAFAIGQVVALPQEHVYVIGLEDGHLRAIDGIVEGSRCAVRWLPDDPRGASKNPRGTPGVYEDTCSSAVWAASGDALAGASAPLRTFEVRGATAPDGTKRAEVEVLGTRQPASP